MKRVLMCAAAAAMCLGLAGNASAQESRSRSYVESGPGGWANASSSSNSWGVRTSVSTRGNAYGDSDAHAHGSNWQGSWEHASSSKAESKEGGSASTTSYAGRGDTWTNSTARGMGRAGSDANSFDSRRATTIYQYKTVWTTPCRGWRRCW